ncbi:MAG: replication-associated recombination protein A, partial [Mycoplasma sp.]|nr:replication-associated recombination protein A [Mycoplasma sp.]
IYYLAILLKDNNLQPIFRRLTAVAYEDIGLANPSIWPKVNSAIEAAKLLGMPEAKLPLAAITIDLALSPKSNSSACAIWDAEEEISKSYYDIPNHIKDSSYSSASKLNVKNYKYPHNFEFNYVEQQYLPNEIKNKKFYKYNKYSANENKYINYWKKVKYEKK